MTVTGKHGRKHEGSGRRALQALAFAAACAAAGLPGQALAGSESHYDRVSLRAERSR